MRETLRGALLGVPVLLFFGLIGGAPADAQYCCFAEEVDATNNTNTNGGNYNAGGVNGVGSGTPGGSGYGDGGIAPTRYGPGAHQCSYELGCPEWSEEEKETINERARQNCQALGADRAQGWKTLTGGALAVVAWLAKHFKLPGAIAGAVGGAAAIVVAEMAYAICQAQGLT